MALIRDAGPAVYFPGGEVCAASGATPLNTIAQLWPSLPASYKLGVKSARPGPMARCIFSGAAPP